MHLSRSPRAWGLAAGTIVLLLLAFGLGLTLDRPDPAPTTDTANLAPGSAAMRIHLDPETGLPGPAKAPTAAELDAELAAMLSRSDEGLVPVHHPDVATRVAEHALELAPAGVRGIAHKTVGAGDVLADLGGLLGGDAAAGHEKDKAEGDGEDQERADQGDPGG